MQWFASIILSLTMVRRETNCSEACGIASLWCNTQHIFKDYLLCMSVWYIYTHTYITLIDWLCHVCALCLRKALDHPELPSTKATSAVNLWAIDPAPLKKKRKKLKRAVMKRLRSSSLKERVFVLVWLWEYPACHSGSMAAGVWNGAHFISGRERYAYWWSTSVVVIQTLTPACGFSLSCVFPVQLKSNKR